MGALQAALKNAIQVTYQLEDAELAAEPLPDADNRQYLLIYESSEGGAGVLRRLVEDAGALAEVARAALELCHFDPATGDDLGHAPNASERCEAACYDCLMSYGNQPDHRNLDRFLIKDMLMQWTGAQVAAAPGGMTRAEHLQRLERLAASDLERRWLRFLHERGYRLPTDAAVLVPEAGTRPDFSYDGDHLVVYVDGPHHQFPERAARDARQTEALRDLGYTIVRFAADDDWEAVLHRYPSVFGAPGGARA
jgi:very-short-patch-repair endonuclease